MTLPSNNRLIYTGAFVALFILILIPFFLCSPLPLSDYPNHLARMHIIANLKHSADLAQYYSLDWSLAPNLAMDLIAPRLIGPLSAESASWLFTAATLFLIASGAIALHRALYGSWSPAPFAAFLLLYNRQFLWGFLNYLFTVGCALWVMAAYVSLRDRGPALRFILFSLLATALLVGHLHAFASYAILVGGYELSILWQTWRRTSLLEAGKFIVGLSQFIVPIGLFFSLSSTLGRAGETRYGALFDKVAGLLDLFNNYSLPLDAFTFVLLAGLAAWGWFRRRLRLHPLMILPLALLSLLYLALPYKILASYGADRRLLIMLVLAAVAAIRIDLPSRRAAAMLVAGIGALFLVRMGVIAVNWAHARQAYAPVLAAIDHVQPGTRLAVLYGGDLFPSLQNPPMDHIGNMAVVKKNVYVNSLFAEPGQQPLRVKTGYKEKFSVSPSQTFRMSPEKIGSEDPFRDLPLERFDYVLLMNPRYFVQNYPAAFRLVFEQGNVKLFRVLH